MQTVVIDASDGRSNIDGIKRAADILRSGGLVVFPTETVYGLGANGLDGQAVQRIFAAKGRPADNPLILHLFDPKQVVEVSSWIPDVAWRLIDRFWPGPLTLIVPHSESVPSAVTAGLDTVGIRMPDNGIALAFLAACGMPVAAPSANISGRPSPTSVQDVIDDLDGRVDCIIDGGECPVGIESTVLDVTGERPVVLRPGAVTVEDIRSVVGEVEVDPSATGTVDCSATSPPKSPGVRYRHYAPLAPVVLFEGDPEARFFRLSSRIKELTAEGKTVGVAVVSESLPRLPRGARGRLVVRDMGAASDPSGIAGALFSVLRAMDRDEVDVILVEGIDDTGVGFAVMNRLRRAAGGNVVRCSQRG